jgi:hypothetical protein
VRSQKSFAGCVLIYAKHAALNVANIRTANTARNVQKLVNNAQKNAGKWHLEDSNPVMKSNI